MKPKHPLKTIVYVDGFNLYYSSLKNTPYRWLNVKKVIKSILDSSIHKIIEIKYFTAKPFDPSSANKHDIYMKALGTLTKFKIIYGKYKLRDIKGLTKKNKLITVSRREEKETDVNIASEIVYDCCKENIESIVLLSNDTDLKKPLWFARKKLDKKVVIITPTDIARNNKTTSSYTTHIDLKRISNAALLLEEEHLKKCLFDSEIRSENNQMIKKPKNW